MVPRAASDPHTIEPATGVQMVPSLPKLPRRFALGRYETYISFFRSGHVDRQTDPAFFERLHHVRQRRCTVPLNIRISAPQMARSFVQLLDCAPNVRMLLWPSVYVSECHVRHNLLLSFGGEVEAARGSQPHPHRKSAHTNFRVRRNR